MRALSNEASDESTRKRTRKGTHSCTECRRRKKSCVAHPNGRKCTECTERGVECLKQGSQFTPRKHPRGESKQGLQDRISRLEDTVQALVGRLDGSNPSAELPEALPRREISPSASDSDELQSETELASAPVLSLFDNAILSRRDDALPKQPNKQASRAASRLDQKTERIRSKLLSLFPPAPLEEQIIKRSLFWEPWQELFPNILSADAKSTTFRDFVLGGKSSGNVQRIAKALLSLIVTLQETNVSDGTFRDYCPRSGAWSDVGSSFPFSQDIERCAKSIHELVLSDDELVSTIDGIECLILQSKHDSNDGRIRHSWIYHRRGLFIAQLIGLHRRSNMYPPDEAARRQSVWQALYQSDRLMSLLLGLPYGIAKNHVDMENTIEQTGTSYFLRLANITGDVIDRNFDASNDSGYLQTVRIEGQLTELARSMPSSWWLSGFFGVENIVSQIYQRLLPQFWHHQVRALLHLPFMLKAGQQAQYQFNRIAALESARAMITLYQTLRPVQGFRSLICKLFDFQVFTAAMLLVLNLLEPSNKKHSEEEDNRDWDLLTTTNDMLQRASTETNGSVASQAARALSIFTKARNCKHPPEFEHACRVVIPYFGTVVFGPGRDFAKTSLPSASTGSGALPLDTAGLPTPTESQAGSTREPANLIPDPFVSLDSYLAQGSSSIGLDRGHFAQPATELPFNDFAFANVNLDLDRDWTWYPG